MSDSASLLSDSVQSLTYQNNKLQKNIYDSNLITLKYRSHQIEPLVFIDQMFHTICFMRKSFQP
jgi:hypothetical protein